MLVDFKSVFLFGLVALSSASPIAPGANQLEARGKKKITAFNCNGDEIAKEDVGAAYSHAKNLGDRTYGSYPHEYKNGEGIFGSAKVNEYPIKKGGVWTGGSPGKWRVVYKREGNPDFVGVMWEGAGSKMTRCVAIPDPPPEADPEPPADPAPPAPPSPPGPPRMARDVEDVEEDEEY